MGKSILAKFKVGSVTDHGNSNHNVSMSPVVSGEENKSFSKFTPSGKIEMHITNPDVIGFFIPGDEYYVSFSKEIKHKEKPLALNYYRFELQKLLDDEDLTDEKLRDASEKLLPSIADLLHKFMAH